MALLTVLQNTTFIELAGILFSMCLNICLQFDLVQMIRQPFKDKGSSIKWYVGVSSFLSIVFGAVCTHQVMDLWYKTILTQSLVSP